MKSSRLLPFAGIALVAIVCPPVAFAQSVPAAPAATAAQLARYDKNQNGVLDADEVAALRADERTAGTAVATASPADGWKPGDVVELSPFSVNAEKDNGFAAT